MRRNHRVWETVRCATLALGLCLWGVVASAAEKAEIEITNDIVYGKVGGEELKLDLASPKGLDRAVPAIVVIHGGGWMQGRRQDMTPFMKAAASRGFVSTTISYRFAPKHRFPAQIEDVKCSVRYLRANAERLKIDPKRIGAIGVSAGAHLSMMLGTLDSSDGLEGDGGNPEQSSKVQAVVSYVGPVNLARASYTDTQTQILDAFLGGKPLQKQDDCRRASPITYVNKGDAAMLLFFGTKDPLIQSDQAMQMSEALTAAGVPARVELIIGAGHGWGGAEAERTLDASMNFFAQHLGQEQAVAAKP
jgi:acetyl esterase/lipase